WLTPSDVRVPFTSKSSFIDFDRVIAFKQKCFKKAWTEFQKSKDVEIKGQFQAFCEQEAYWLDDYALFDAAKKEFKNKAWFEWPEPIRSREAKALKKLAERLEENIGYAKFVQFIFHKQWHKLHDYAKEKGVKIMGDMPIFISHDSADTWANQKLFDLNEDGTAKTVAGVPPDYFSATGQLWGNPQYDWKAMEKENYSWWKKRFQNLSRLVDIVRIDHFRGFESYWEVDGKAETAINGHWRKGPGKAFFDIIKKEIGDMEIVAEDLGIITDEVEALREACGFPGMKVLHFTLHFNEQGRLGFVAPENSIVYTGTHDNNTTVGWYNNDIDEATRAAVAALLNKPIDRPRDVAKGLLSFALASEARLAIVPMQDLLGMDERGRMNTPGTVGLNWKWCLKPDYQFEVDAAELKNLCKKYKRC
ncbi:MAG: 4-alpha-glucanotransferase, partial [Selenomonas sp.]|nr:4-alpha-glucanotransferase [Selenomonas sp.]